MHRRSAHSSFVPCLAFALLFLALGSAPGAALESSMPTRVPVLSGTDSASGPSLRVLEESPDGLRLVFELPALEVDQLEVEGRTWHVMAIEGGGFVGAVGEPMLPTYSRLIEIPDRAGVVVEATAVETHELSGYRPAPMQPEDGSGFIVDAAAYARQGYGPAARARIGEPALMRGLRVVPITIQPVRYDPARGTVEVAGRIEVQVTFAGVDLRNAAGGAPQTVPSSFDRLYRQTVVNYGDPRGGEIVGLGCYVLICPNDANVTSALQPLIEWRTRQGYEVHLATTAETGTTTTSIKAWLQNAYDTWVDPPEYITLVGDVSGAVAIPCWYETYSGYNGETDHNYCQLDGTDILADAHIGRLSVDSVSQLQLVVYKIVSYESTPYMDDTSWYTRACLCGDPYDSGYTCVQLMQWLKERLRQVGYAEVDTIFGEPFVSGMTTKLNRGDGAFCYRGIMGMSGFTTGHISSLTNGRKMPFAVNLTCDTGSFAHGTSRSEAWLRGGAPPSTPTAGIASIGTSTTGTHTRYNNCITNGIWRAAYWEGQYHFGEALTRGKYELYVNYAVPEMSYCQRYTCWNNLMGDAAGELWTAVPRAIVVTHPAQIALGASAVTVGVTQAGAACAGAYVCVWKGNETFVGGYTDATGSVTLPIHAASVGPMKVTVTKHDHRPYLGELAVAVDDLFVGYLAHSIDDDNAGGSLGNGDHIANPGETLELRVQAKNYGLMTATNVTGTLSTDDPFVTILDAEEDFGNLPAGGTAWCAEDFDVRLDGGIPDGHTVYLYLDLASGSEQWRSVVALPVAAASFSYRAVTLTGFGSQIDPGESGQISVRVRNDGGATGPGLQGTLISSSPWLTVNDPHAAYGTIDIGATGENTADPFGLSVASETFPGHVADMRLILRGTGGASDTVRFALQVGTPTTHDPTGPDRYGYYAFDNTDTGYPQAPTYHWIEIATNYGGSGTSCGFNDNSQNEGDVITLTLPFSFQYYGEVFTRATICSNGWIAMGSTYITNYHNWNIPGAGAPAYMIAPMWDDLYESSSDRVYYLNDAANHRFIVQWSRLRNAGAWYNNTENFEVILYDPAYYPTDTGDGMIDMQYEEFRNVDQEQMYCTVGIENRDRTDGVMYTYCNYYNAGAATISSGRAIRFLPIVVEVPAGAGDASTTPLRLALQPCRPNPFGAGVGTTALMLELPRASAVRLGIFDAGGRRVRTLIDGRMPSGVHRHAWDGRDDGGHPASAGVYFSVLEVEGQRIARPVTLIR